MPTKPHNKYLEHEVLNAPPQKLQLLLLEGAIRHVQRGQHFLASSNVDAACEAIIRAQEIVAQLLGGINSEGNPALVRQVAGEYAFLIRALSQANLQRDASLLSGALRVLETQRDTWREVCQQMGTQQRTPPPHFAPTADAPGHLGAAPFTLDA